MAVIAQGDATPIFEFAEGVFDFMPLFVESFIVINLFFAVLARGNAWRDIDVAQGLPVPIGVISLIRQQHPRLGHDAQ